MDCRMKENFQYLLRTLNIEVYRDKNYIIVFPPFSALYRYLAQQDAYYENYINFIHHMANTMGEYKNVRLLLLIHG